MSYKFIEFLEGYLRFENLIQDSLQVFLHFIKKILAESQINFELAFEAFVDIKIFTSKLENASTSIFVICSVSKTIT